MVSSEKLTFALVGHGQAGNSFYNALAGLPEVRFRWVIGRRLDRVAEFARERNIPHYGIEFEAVLLDPTIDTILICTPNELHYNQALLALQAGKHVVVEVPLTMNYREAQRLVQVASARELFLSVPHIGRYLTTVRQAKDLLLSAGCGHIHQLVYRRLMSKRKAVGWTGRPRVWIDSVSWHHAAHAVEMAGWLLGEPLHCIGAAISCNAAHDQSTDVSAIFVTPLETIVTLTLSYNSIQQIFDCILVGENGLLELQDFTKFRRNGVDLVREAGDEIESLEQAYRHYALDLVAGLRGEKPVPLSGAEMLPIMEQVERMHALADGKNMP